MTARIDNQLQTTTTLQLLFFLPVSSLVRLLFPHANFTFFPRAPFPGGNASGCRPHPGKRSHHPLPGYCCPVTNHLARLGFFVHQKPVESAGQNRATFIPTVHQRNSIDSTSLPAGTVQTGRTFRVLQVRGDQSRRTHRLHARPRPPHYQHEIRGRRGESTSPAWIDDRLSLIVPSCRTRS